VGDREMLQVVFQNILMNAAQAMAGQGSVHVNITVSDSKVRVDVIDSGPGMPEEVREKAFNAFFTTKHRGTGLGLPIALRVVESHGGSMRIELPPSGGDTGFANMYLALETLPASLRSAIADKTIKHDKRYTSGGQLRPGYLAEQDLRTSPGLTHPIIRRHPETGRSALYLGRRPHAYINGLPLAESEALLDSLWTHATQPHFTWHHQWRLGDVLIWDNRCAMHRRDAIDPSTRRIMHRTQCKGSPVVQGI